MKNHKGMLKPIFVFILFSFLIKTNIVAQGSRQSDSLELVKLYDATNGDNWTNKSNWKVVGRSIDTWFGIKLTNGRVTGIDLDGIDDFSGSDFTSTGNNLRGILPTLSFSALTFLDLDTNKGLKGDLPAMTLPEITLINLGKDSFSGNIPSSWNFPKLEYLALCCNQLQGSIPKELGNFSNLKGFYLQNNKLSGCIPIELENLCGQIISADISNNVGLSTQSWTNFCNSGEGMCTLQDTNSCRYRDSLVLLDFYKAMNGNSWKRKDNWLSSEPISNWYGVYVGPDSCVVTLDFDGVSDGDGNGYTGNGLNGVFPASICNLSELRHLYLSANTNLRGSIPNTIGQLSKLINLHFNLTSISGALPDSLWNMTQMEGLSLSGCQINTPLPTKIGNLVNLRYFIADNCNWTGALPASISNLTKMRYFLVANNRNLVGTIPSNLGQMTTLSYFNLGGNALTGNIPNSVGQLKKLETLILGGNKLSGSIPPEIGDCDNLQGLYLSDNTNLEGNIPTSIGNLKRLKYLWLQGNMLSGEIPAIIGSMDSLEDIVLSRNKFTGKIDASFNRLKVKRLHFDNNLIDSVPSLINIPLADSIAVASLDGRLQVGGLTIDSNALTFDDILPNRNFLNTAYLKYIPQKTFFKDTSITLTTGCDLELDLKIDGGIKDNTYKWFQSGNNNVKYSSTINKLILKNIQPSDAGDYTCQVTNSGALGLTLLSKTITLKVIPPVSTTRNKTICFGQKDTLPKGRIISTAGTYRDTLKSRNGCDSAIIVTNLTVAPIRVEKSTQNICWGTNLKIKDSLVTKGGIYRDTLRSAEGCITVNEVTVIIDSIKVVKEDSLCKGQEYRLPSGTMVNKIGEYQDTVKRPGQCDTIYTVILKEGCLPLIKVYNGITPDGDDNKYLVVEEIVDYPKSQLLIYSRTNDLIFRSAIPYDNKWNGTDQNGTPLPADTYYYILDLGLPNQKPLRGYILLMR